jgi:hypothetical protein
MGIGRSTYYDAAPAPTDDTAIVEAIAAICEEVLRLAAGSRGSATAGHDRQSQED